MDILEGKNMLASLALAALSGGNRSDQLAPCLCRITDCAQCRLNRQFDLCRVGNFQKIRGLAKEDLAAVLHKQHFIRLETQRLLDTVLDNDNGKTFSVQSRDQSF